MIRRILLLSAFVLTPAVAVFSQKTRVQRSLQDLADGFGGNVGFFVKDLRTGSVIFSHHADTLFPTASMVKIPILISVMDRIARGEIDYREKLVYKDSLYYAGEDILGSFKDGEEIALDKVIMLMLTMSDNTASLWLQQIGGTGERINALMDSIGLENTRVNSRTPGRRPDWEVYGWGQSTPAEMAKLLEMIWRGKLFDRSTSERMLRNLKRNYWDGEALSVIPPDVNTYSKNGAVSTSRSEVVLVNGKQSDYVFCIMTSEQKDDSWSFDNEGWTLIRKISALLYEYFENSDPVNEVMDDRYK